MATIINRTKCEDCIHVGICVKKNKFNDLLRKIEAVSITNGNELSVVHTSIKSELYQTHVYIECDYFIKNQNYRKQNDGILLCKKNGVEE